MNPISPERAEELPEPQGSEEELDALIDEWLITSGRTKTFQAFLDSLESRAVKRSIEK
jgi:hypothetical protein